MTLPIAPERFPPPPRHLSRPSQDFWKRTVRGFELGDQHLLVLQAALEAWDRGQEARKIISANETGPVVFDKAGMPRVHPMCVVERDCRTAFLRAMTVLDLEGEPNPSNRRT